MPNDSKDLLVRFWHLDVDCVKTRFWDIDLHGEVRFVHDGQRAVHQGLVQVQHQGFVWKKGIND